jgi:hypothetical protein
MYLHFPVDAGVFYDNSFVTPAMLRDETEDTPFGSRVCPN